MTQYKPFCLQWHFLAVSEIVSITDFLCNYVYTESGPTVSQAHAARLQPRQPQVDPCDPWRAAPEIRLCGAHRPGTQFNWISTGRSTGFPTEYRTLCKTKHPVKNHVEQSVEIHWIDPQLTEETTGLIGRRELAKMKKSAVLVNVSRGPVVDTEALTEALKGFKRTRFLWNLKSNLRLNSGFRAKTTGWRICSRTWVGLI